jgi:hypothetical protein
MLDSTVSWKIGRHGNAVILITDNNNKNIVWRIRIILYGMTALAVDRLTVWALYFRSVISLLL